MPRTAAANPKTREKLLDAATRLMIAQGYAATSVDRICAAARVTKGAFFHYFKSKEDLARAALQRFCESAARRFEGFLTGEREPLRRVLRYLDGLIAMARDPEAARGCLLGELSQELCGCASGIQAQCCAGFDAWAERFARELAAAKAVHAPRAGWDPRGVADHVIAVLEGSLILARARRNPAALAENLEREKEFVRGLFAK